MNTAGNVTDDMVRVYFAISTDVVGNYIDENGNTPERNWVVSMNREHAEAAALAYVSRAPYVRRGVRRNRTATVRSTMAPRVHFRCA